MFQCNLLKRVILLLTVAFTVMAADTYTEADLGVSLDYSRFSIEGGVYLDIYLMIPQSFFSYLPGENGLEAKAVFQVALIQDDLVPYPPDRWQRTYRAADQAAVAGLSYVPDISKFYVEAGEYLLQVDIIDLHSNSRQRIRKPIILELFPAEDLTLSDITIASKIIKVDHENEFTKYGYDVVPNAERSFNSRAPMLYYYFEAYGLSGAGDFQVHTQVLSLNEDVIQDYPIRTKKMPGTSAVEWGGVNTAGLRSGIHKLLITVTDQVSGQHVSTKKTFYVLKPSNSEQAQATAGSDYSTLSESQLDDIFKVASLVMAKKEQRLFKYSDIEGKRNVLTAFWDRNDPDPETAINEFKTQFYQRVQLANREYSTETKEGWKADRGRVLIQYGHPNNIERAPSALGQKPWESWEYYEIEGGIQFFFVDRTGYGIYQLVHSSARDEVQNYDWQRYLD
ncbi:MAG: GWxTD domain-containing protein [Candidatus Marinimicrobia bacterium]|nr:GWxTD domain-containing protein [Candidatus Neomarinimicrobiota bacterium]